MNVGELRNLLSGVDDDMEIFVCDSRINVAEYLEGGRYLPDRDSNYIGGSIYDFPKNVPYLELVIG